MGSQFSIWLHSKHAQAYASLAGPEADKIAKLSGIAQEPQEAAICLGCHAPAALHEDWEKDDTFVMEDGVQCEDCHGPGSEYRYKPIMRDREKAMSLGLKMPKEEDCMTCHLEKGSHMGVLSDPLVDPKEGMKKTAHPLKKNPKTGKLLRLGISPDEAPEGPKYVGSMVCAKCHKGPEKGYQFSWWRRDPHAQAFASLGTPKGRKMARRAGVKGDPQRSQKCLTCHVSGYETKDPVYLSSFSIDEGVGCEGCHGPGSEYSDEEIMQDLPAAQKAGLNPGSGESCAPCHQKAHGKPFDLKEAMKKIAHPSEIALTDTEPKYKTPLNMAVRPDGNELYVACESSHSVIVVDAKAQEKVAEIPVGMNPADVTFDPDGKRAFVSNRHDDTVSVIDVEKRKVIQTLPVGDEPHGMRIDRKFLYVLNTSSEDISVFDAKTLKWVKNLSANRGPWSMSEAPDGESIWITNSLSQFAPLREPFFSEITVIETAGGTVKDRIKVDGANLMMGIDWHPSGRYALATLNRTKTLVPMTRLLQGWSITNGLAILWRDGRVDQVLLDEPNLGFADATDVAITPDGRHALATSATTDRLAVVDLGKLENILKEASAHEREAVLPNHLGVAPQVVIKHIPTRTSPRGVTIMPGGGVAFVANALDDSLSVINLETWEEVKRIDLGGSKEITKERWGEQVFHNADITFHRQFSCHSCHPDGHIDGLTYDIAPDGIGFNPVDNRTLRGVLDTAPFKWTGKNPNLKRQCGPRLAVFFTRIQPFTPEQLDALDSYITRIPRPPNRFHPPGSKFTEAQRRGRLMFERKWTNDGRVIPPNGRCVTCHDPPYYTDRKKHDVGTKAKFDLHSEFDTPHLNNIYDSAPYLHNGMSKTLEEIWTVYNPDDKHGVTNDMTKDQLNDLIEYLKTL